MKGLIGLLLAMAVEEFAQERLDTTPKEVGNKVLPVDKFSLAYFIEVDNDEQIVIGREVLNEELESKFLSQPMVVISTNIEKIYKCGHCDNDHKHDTIVYVPGLQKQYFTSSRDLKIVE